MPRVDRRLAAALLVALAACGAIEPPPRSRPWTADVAAAPLTHADCVRLACSFGPVRGQWRARFAAAAARADAAGMLPNPTLVADWEDLRLWQTVPEAVVQQTYSLTFAIGDLLTRGRRQEIAAHQLQAELADLLAERRQLAIDVCRSYDELVAARRTAAIAGDAATTARAHRDGALRLVAAGVEAPVAAAQADAAVLDAEAAAAAAARDSRVLEVAFAFALGFDRPVALELADPIDATAPEGDLEALLVVAAASRPQLLAASHRCEAELERLRLLRSPLRFVPVVGAGYRRLGQDQLGVTSLELALPVFDTGSAAIAEADAGLRAATAAADLAAHDVAREVTVAAATGRAAAAELAEAIRPAAARRRELAAASRRWFEAGELAFVDLREPELAVFDADRAVVAAELAAATAVWPLRIDALLAAMPDDRPDVPGGD